MDHSYKESMFKFSLKEGSQVKFLNQLNQVPMVAVVFLFILIIRICRILMFKLDRPPLDLWPLQASLACPISSGCLPLAWHLLSLASSCLHSPILINNHREMQALSKLNLSNQVAWQVQDPKLYNYLIRLCTQLEASATNWWALNQCFLVQSCLSYLLRETWWFFLALTCQGSHSILQGLLPCFRDVEICYREKAYWQTLVTDNWPVKWLILLVELSKKFLEQLDR